MKVKRFEWNKSKNEVLKKERGVSFEDVVSAIEAGDVISDETHHNVKKYPNQRLYTVKLSDYVYVVPYVEDVEKKFLKTIFPSRKAAKKYLNNK